MPMTVFDVDQRGLTAHEIECLHKLHGAELANGELALLTGPKLLQCFSRVPDNAKLLAVAERLGQFQDIRFSPFMVIWATIFCDSPGTMDLWAWSILQKTRELGEPFTLDKLQGAGPVSAPSEEAVHRLLAEMDLPDGSSWLDGEEAWLPAATEPVAKTTVH